MALTKGKLTCPTLRQKLILELGVGPAEVSFYSPIDTVKCGIIFLMSIFQKEVSQSLRKTFLKAGKGLTQFLRFTCFKDTEKELRTACFLK